MISITQALASIRESADPAWDELQQLIAKHRPDVDATCHKDPKGFTVLSHLQVRRSAPSGAGTAFMNDLVRWVDRHREMLTLQTATKGNLKKSNWKTTTSSDRLKRFYSRFGFKSNYGSRSYRVDLPGNMHREPAT